MIERQKISGRDAFVAYMTPDFRPADKVDAGLIKVMFDDGETIFVTPKKNAKIDRRLAALKRRRTGT